MQLTITEPDRMATVVGVPTFDRFCSWLLANQVNPQQINGSQNITVTSVLISGTTVFSTTFAVDVTVPMPEDLAQVLESVYHPSEDPEATSLDDMAHLVKQLQDARAESKAAKEKEDEARDQILARIRERGGEYGTVAGQRVVHVKAIVTKRFKTVEFKKDHPDIAEQYTGESTSYRLETL
jgi:hypothetical protein